MMTFQFECSYNILLADNCVYNHTNPHGDWEVLKKFRRLNVCANPTGIQARAIIPEGADGFTMGSTQENGSKSSLKLILA